VKSTNSSGIECSRQGNLSQALAMRQARLLVVSISNSCLVGQCPGDPLGPLVDRSNRVDFFADRGDVQV
jgi:hypothetical protein